MIQPIDQSTTLFRAQVKINGSQKTICNNCGEVVYQLIKGIDDPKQIKAEWWRKLECCSRECAEKFLKKVGK